MSLFQTHPTPIRKIGAADFGPRRVARVFTQSSVVRPSPIVGPNSTLAAPAEGAVIRLAWVKPLGPSFAYIRLIMRKLIATILVTATVVSSSAALAASPIAPSPRMSSATPSSRTATPTASMQETVRSAASSAVRTMTYDRQGYRRQQGERVNIRRSNGSSGWSIGLRSLGVGRETWSAGRVGDEAKKTRTSWRFGTRGSETIVTKKDGKPIETQTYKSGGVATRTWTATLDGKQKLGGGLTLRTHAEGSGGDNGKIGLHRSGTATSEITDKGGNVVAKKSWGAGNNWD
jgi:hypothetical protein